MRNSKFKMQKSKPQLKIKNFKFFLVILPFAFLLLTLFLGCGTAKSDKAEYYCPMHPTYTSDKPGDCPICNMKLVKKEKEPVKEMGAMEHAGHQIAQKPEAKSAKEICLEHSCTMNNCEMKIKADIKPGEKVVCPICGEYITAGNSKLVPAAPQAAKTGLTVTIDPQKQQLIGVKSEPVKRRELAKVIRASGKIAYDPELAVTQEEFIQALSNEDKLKDSPLQDVIDRAIALTEAARRKLRLLGMSDEQIAGLESSREAQTNLYLPGKGENVWAYISIYEYEIGLVRVGAAVDIEAVAYPGEIFEGVVKSINPVLDPQTRTNQVRCEVKNSGDKLKPEMFVNAKIKISIGDKLAVPESAVMDTGTRKLVFLSREGGVFESREVKLGQKAEGFYEVIEGLSEGDIVITSGNFLIDAESRLKSAVSGESHMHGQ
jgi:Cu(I)/Ag(I) efflux system membrane fusion protein